jgi:hypothetical protein
VAFAIYALVLAPVAVLIVRNRRAAHWAWRGGQRIRRRLPWCKNRDESDTPFPTALLDAVADARTRPHAMRELLFHAVVSKVLGAIALAAAITAVGLPITAAGALVIYATALAASLLTIVPGGIGTVEASTTALLIGAGATAGAAALAVALFRLFDLWLPVLTGAAVARRDARRDRRAPEAEPQVSLTMELARLEHWATASAHL